MKVKIKEIRNASMSEWETIWLACDWSTYFHSPEWAEIWTNYTDGRMQPEPKLVVFSDGKEVLLPFSMEKGIKGWTRRYVSSPGGTFGGWLSAEYLNLEHAESLVRYITKNHKDIVWRVNPYDNVLYKLKVKMTQKDETHAIDLNKGMDAIIKTWTKGHRSAVAKAEREGIKVKQAITIEDWMEYYEVYEDSLKRWGDKATSRYSKNFFEDMFKRQSLNIRLWIGKINEKIITGALCFYAKRHAVYWHGATLEKYFNLRPSNLVVAKAIENAAERRFKWFDFNPSGGHEGVKSFKKSFGAVSYPAGVYERKSLKGKLIGAIFRWLR